MNEIPKNISKYIVIMLNKEKQKTIPLPDYGEVKIVCHDGNIKTIETTIKEKI